MSTRANPATGVSSSAALASTGAGSLWTGKRLYISVLLFLNLFINYIDRVNLSVAGPAIAKHFGWHAGQMGVIFSSFQWTYCLVLLVWGWMADRFGTRLVNGVSVTIWSIAAMLTGFASSFGTMLATRLVLGVGEAASFPTSGKVVRQWFPPRERGVATAIFNAGTFAGPAFFAPVVAWLLLKVGWRASFVLTGSLGFLWVLVWLKFFRVPSECSWLPEEERGFLVAQTNSQLKSAVPPKASLLRLLSRKTLWGLFLTQGCCAYTMLLFLFWLPSYLVQSRHMSIVKAGWFTSLPYVAAAFVGLLVGRVSDRILTEESLKRGGRRTLLIVFILLSGSVLLTNMIANELLLLFAISVSLASISGTLSLNIALTSDLVWNPEMVGTAIGFLILGGNIFGSFVPIVTGYIVQWTGSFDLAFYLAAFLLFLAALVSFSMTRQPLAFEREERQSKFEPLSVT